MELICVQRARHPADWHVGYIDGRAAIGNAGREWFFVDDQTIVHNRQAQLVWMINHQSGQWECLHEKLWPQDTLKDAFSPAGREPDYVE